MVTFVAKDSLKSDQIPDVWYNVRKKVGDIKQQLPLVYKGHFLMMNLVTPLAISMY
jgi:multidrug efflux pump